LSSTDSTFWSYNEAAVRLNQEKKEMRVSEEQRGGEIRTFQEFFSRRPDMIA
jgi:hypothetical protein